MHLLLLTFFLALLGISFGQTDDLRRRCRCLSTDSCWPSTSEFAALASRLSKPLIYPLPAASPCYPPSNPSGNCTEVQQNWNNGIWRAKVPGQMQQPNFEAFEFPNGTIHACFLNTTLGIPCNQGSIPVIGVDARTVSDVQAAVEFAKRKNLRVVVKNTGHDYLGRSTARGAFMIWTHNFQEKTYNGAFVPQGGPASKKYKAMTIGAGVQWRDAFLAAQSNGRVLAGGVCDTVGASGGWVLGGGHSILSGKYGLGVDNVLQFSVVTSEGNYLIVNAYSHSQLFWALRGGGGGTYGIVISATYATHGLTPLIGQVFVASATTSTAQKKLMAEFLRITPRLSDAGWGVAAFFSDKSLTLNSIGPSLTWSQANATWDPFFAFAQNMAPEGITVSVALTIPFNSWFDWYSTQPQLPTGFPLELASRLLPRSVIGTKFRELAELTVQGPGGFLNMWGGGAVTSVGANETGLNPAWRNTLAHLVILDSWPEGATISVIESARDRLRLFLTRITQLAPGLGSYFNEASLYERDFKNTFFGSHYDTLRAIKSVYDPSDLFVVAEGVGSDEWDASLNCRV